jgi:23S rRNA (uracil1939-C5)-methyltransferase
MVETIEIEIARLGAQGDGVAQTPDGLLFVPYTLGGERITAEFSDGKAHLVSVLTPSQERVAPPCTHFGSCGGCKLQHMRSGAYLAWKREQVIAAFSARGIDAPVTPVIACRGPRRRAVLGARGTSAGVLLGFHREASHELIDIDTCVVMHPGIVAALGDVRRLIAPLMSRSGELRVTLTWTAGGLDIAVDDVAAKLTPELRAKIAGVAAAARFARVSIARDPVYQGLTPLLHLGPAEVVPPPGSFLQAVAEMEEEMARLILDATGKSKTVADLFCGVGAFTFRLAQRARVFAADSDKAAVAALNAATKPARGLKPIEARMRDLFREPLSATELRDFECVVFDPPRAGADAQARMIARSKVKTVVAVSCSPATLARDARMLLDGGYKIESITPLDQFQYSPHIEAVAVFRR